ncbi:CHAT domain-containing protein [Chloroflexus sp. MS-CIW-1]|uniref:CHAT domain-containing protein n=2 Tax=unclassified Chloroflexus TaxID=2633855 RepID=UPI002648F9BB|nr:CHAT domain-containing protein [Chloroflexus sp. MS-CIW-1]MDN5273902.1 CHAT domain-containing protein [Chloroflexus sp. MS-CIW-1]
MPISHAEPITLTCPACGTSHTADIWLIVAPDERPDLVEQIRNGTLHTATCPQCGQTRTLDAPLLIFRPTAEPPILFSPAQQTTSEQDQQHAAALIDILRQRLGAAWNDAWLGQGLTVVPRPMLLVALTDDPALVQAVNAFLNARTWIDSYREVQAHPELLSDEALAMLDQAIAAARAANNADAVAFFEAHRALLRRCREVGAAAAFAEKIGVSVEQIRGVDAETALPPEVQQMIARITQLNRISDMPERVELCRQALTLVTRATHPRLWAALNVKLGNSLVQNPRGERGENLEQAIALYQQALAVITREAMPVEWATTMMNLATAYSDRIRGDRAQNLEEAIAAYRQALEIFTPEGMPDDCRRTARQLGAMYAETGRWEAATGAYDLALQAAEILYGESVSPSGKAAELEATGTLFRSAAYALVRAARPGALRRAVEVAELGRARGLGETLTRDRSDLSIIERDYPDIYERYRTAAEIVRSLERTDRASADRQDTAQLSFTDLANRIRAARADLDAAIEAIRAIPGYEAFLRPPTYAEIAAAAQPGVPLVYLITTPQGSLALIVPDGNAEPEALLLDEFTENDLNNLLLVRTGDKVVGGYLPGQLLGGEALTKALETALPLLGEHLIAPVAQRLRTLNATGVTLIPTGLLSLLPLHAATYTVNGASRCLLDEFDVAYAPSARVLSIAQREQQRRAAKGVRLAGVGNPTGDLRYAGAELHSICDLLPPAATTTFYEQAATRSAIWSALGESTIGHFSCHGSFADDPLDSALHLAAGDRITLRDLVAGDTTALSNLRLVALSACQTAITDFRRLPDESIGLPGGFLQAGVPAVVGTLWSVNDLSTALLMHRFYELHLHGDAAAGLAPQPPVRALRLAQQWLRDLTYKEMFAYFQRHRQLKAAPQRNLESVPVPGARMPTDLIEEGRALAEDYMLDHPNDHPYANPIFWAAFTFNGTMGEAA